MTATQLKPCRFHIGATVRAKTARSRGATTTGTVLSVNRPVRGMVRIQLDEHKTTLYAWAADWRESTRYKPEEILEATLAALTN